jgi:multicomponent Na+:H+ antiporter subunit G
MIGEVLALVGALLTLLAAIGVVRFRDVLERMHAVTKASTVGLLFVLAGTAFAVPAGDITTLVLAGMSQLVTMPVGAFLIGRATYRAEGIEARVDVVDELAGVELGAGEVPTSPER